MANGITDPLGVFSIVISEKGGAERRQFFDQSGVSVGRVQGNDLVLPKGNVSKRHCRVEVVDGQFYVTDQGSTNGTYLNRRRIAQSTAVRQGDRIYVGDFVLRIEEGASGSLQPLGEPSVMAGGALTSSSEGEASLPSSEPEEHGPLEAQGARPTGHAPGPSLPAPSLRAGPPRPASLRPGAPTLSSPPPKHVTSSGGASLTPASPGHVPQTVRPAGPTLSDSTSISSGEQQQVSSGQLGSGQVSSGRRTLTTTAEDDGTLALIAPTAFVVERVLALVPAVEFASPHAAPRVGEAIERVFAELERETGALPPALGQQVRLAASAELLALGPLTQLLDDPSVTEIAASGTGHLVVVRGALQQRWLPFCAAGSLERAVERLCAGEGMPLAPGELVATRQLLGSGFELRLIRGHVSPHGAILRLSRRDRVALGLEDLVRLGTISRAMATLFQHCQSARGNVLVVGPVRSGAMELVSALATSGAGGDRSLVVSATTELSDAEGRLVPLSVDDQTPLAEVLSQVAALPGHRLIVDDLLHTAHGFATLQAIFQGADGVVAGLPARNVERGIAQLCAQLALNVSGLAAGAVERGIALSFDLAVEVARLRDGRSRVLRVCELGSGDGGAVVGEDIFNFRVERIASGGAIEGAFHPTGRQPRFALEQKTRGVRMDSGIFGRAPRAPHPG